MNIIFFDNPATRTHLLPFTFTRPVAEIRVGILTIREKWERRLSADYSYLTEPYLTAKFPAMHVASNYYLDGSVLPSEGLIAALVSLKENHALFDGETLIAYRGKVESLEELLSAVSGDRLEKVQIILPVNAIRQVFHIFLENGAQIRDDFAMLTYGRKSQPVADPHTVVYGKEKVFIEENVAMKAAVLNAENGPIYIGAHTEIGEGSVIRGNNAICEHSVLNFHTKIRGDSTIGPHSKVGGEISNSVIFGYSSKAHDGFLGNSVIGEWCNLGAGTNTSNLKNNYRSVRIWNYHHQRFVDTGRQFCGLMMGDHSKCGINTMFNTGTVVGVSANIFGSGFSRSFIPSFSWGGNQGFVTFKLRDALDLMPLVMERRGHRLTPDDTAMYEHIFDITRKFRPDTPR